MKRSEIRETTQQAADRLGVLRNTLYRQYDAAVRAGTIVVDDADLVAGRVYLTRQTWDLIHRTRRPPGRPPKM